ncbi:hypothetical protein AZE42_12519 [Rhizopogon vesiculosus]|uniref:Uncharacterized protein n=1 Tax=Rhizopogon vesiculosus TaxID=180088 RepID=A0A1J8Q2B5_9AGAM|nr:hypothetical protein AZE42_12519 [Rhizopogon vesiculosus]
MTMPLAATLLANAVEIAESLMTPKSHKNKELAVIGTKPASIHTIQFYEAFINIWSDAVTDPTTEHWLS